MRLYPVAPFLTRFLPDDSRVGEYIVPKDVSTGKERKKEIHTA
jgi:hypothetical protein